MRERPEKNSDNSLTSGAPGARVCQGRISAVPRQQGWPTTLETRTSLLLAVVYPRDERMLQKVDDPGTEVSTNLAGMKPEILGVV